MLPSLDTAALRAQFTGWAGRIDWLLIAVIITGGLMCAWLVAPAPLLGHDWISYFAADRLMDQYPAWIPLVLQPLRDLPPRTGLAVLQGFTLSAPPILAFSYARKHFPERPAQAYLAAALILLSPLPWVMCWLGQIEVVALLGIASIPIGIPLLFAKPHFAAWAALNTRWNIFWMAVFTLFTLAVWQLWPLDLVESAYANRIGTDKHPLGMGWAETGFMFAVLGVLLLAATDRSPWRLMAAGSFVSPFLMPYHYFLLLPALGLVTGYRQLGLWLLSWLPLITLGLTNTPTKILAYAFPIGLWLLLAPSLKPDVIAADPDTAFNRGRAAYAEALELLKTSRNKKQA